MTPARAHEIGMGAEPGRHRRRARVGDLERHVEAVLAERQDLAGAIVERRAIDAVREVEDGAARVGLGDRPRELPALTVDRVRLGGEVRRQLVGPALEAEPTVGDPVRERHQREARRREPVAGRKCPTGRSHEVAAVGAEGRDRAAEPGQTSSSNGPWRSRISV